MTPADLLQMVLDGEGSSVEFKDDQVHPDSLAKEMSALLNFEGGHILLGVSDQGELTGLKRSAADAEQWVMNVASNNVRPSPIPSWSVVALENDVRIGVIRLPADSPDKPYDARRGSSWVTFIRKGTSSREASREEVVRLYQSASLVRHDIRPVAGAQFDSLDRDRLENYFNVVLDRTTPRAESAWQNTLSNIDIMTDLHGRTVATAAGLLLFGANPNRFLPQAGVTAAAFPGKEKSYDTVDEERIRGPLVSLLSTRRRVVESGVIDRAVEFVTRNMGSVAWLDGGRRRRRRSFAAEAIRESIVNAVAHRDYTLAGTDIEVSLYEDRLEVISPGRLPNGVTVEKMAEGLRAARNELLKEILRDYGYVEHMGMGVRNRIIASMRAHNGSEPELIEDENRFTVRLWK